MPTDARLQELVDRDDCVRLVHTLARGLDRQDGALIADLFHPDATDDHGGFKGSAVDFLPWAFGLLDGMIRTQHFIGNVLVEIDGDRARGESYFIAHHTLPGSEGERFMIAAGRYLDRFERRDGRWRIAHRHAVYDWSSDAPSADVWQRDAMPGYAFGRRGQEDPSYAHLAI